MNISEVLKEAKTTVTASVMENCNIAKRLEDSGDYADAARALGGWWQGIGFRPDVDHLPAGERAAILARVGALSGWLGSAGQIAGSQEKAKDLISEGAHVFEIIGDHPNWAETRSDLAICYWREGAFDEARVIIEDILENNFDLAPELEAKILLRAVNVEISTCHYSRALDHINRATPLIEQHKNQLLLGKLYFHQALIFHCHGEDKNNTDYLSFAVEGYKKASVHYKKARHSRYVAMSENNIGNAYRSLKDFSSTHSHLDNALRMYVKLKDKGRAALVYDNKARTFIAQGNLSDAELAALTSVNMLRDGGENAALAESLITLGVVLSRGKNLDEAIKSFTEAKEAALTVGDTESAGNAALTQIEELHAALPPIVFRSLYLEADELLKDSSKKSNADRLKKIARKQFEINDTLTSLIENEKAGPVSDWENFSLSEAVRAYEGEIIQQALEETGGRITRTALLLGISHQSLSVILQQRHKELKKYCRKRKTRTRAN